MGAEERREWWPTLLEGFVSESENLEIDAGISQKGSEEARRWGRWAEEAVKWQEPQEECTRGHGAAWEQRSSGVLGTASPVLG